MKVLLAIESTNHSWETIEAVASALWPPQTLVRVVSAVEVLVPASPEMWCDSAGVFEDAQQEKVKSAEKMTARAADLLSGCGLIAEGVVREGSPRQVIVDEAKDWEADLVVVGSRANTGIKRWLLGSVAEYVVSHAPCSVEVIRKRPSETQVEFAAAA